MLVIKIKKSGKMVKRFVKKKLGLSPIITTVLLIALTIVITSVVFLWFRGMVEEGVTKFEKNIKLVCDDVEFEADYNSGTLSIVNNGNVPLFRINLKISKGGNYQTKDITELSGGANWPDTGLASGATFSGDIGSDNAINNAESILVVPVLIGTSSKEGKKTFICEGQYGKEISL